MGRYSENSLKIIETIHPDLQVLFQEVVKVFDNTPTSGHRTPEHQFELFKEGRTLIDGAWIVTNADNVLTTVDGITKLSKHNLTPSEALDVIPYPINGKDYLRVYHFAGWVLGIAIRLKIEGKITHSIRWGGDWDSDTEVQDNTFNDLCHFEIII
jgi:peptidoglycan L-alanyl-D-glutamate endopeptidase CwlK